MTTALIMMQKDEDRLLWPWVRYHGSRFGYHNCYIFDNGSTCSSALGHLAKASELGVNVIYDCNTRRHYDKKNEIVKRKIDDLRRRGDYRTFVPLDCDEFLALNDGDGVSLRGDLVQDHIDEVWKEGDNYLRVSARYKNSPVERDRFYKVNNAKMIFLAGSRSGKVDHGFHMGNLNEAHIVQSRLVYIEFHNRPHQETLRSAREKLALRVPDFSQETLKGYTGPGHHLAKYFLMDEKEYLRRTHTSRKLVEIGMSAEFRRLGVNYPFIEQDDE